MISSAFSTSSHHRQESWSYCAKVNGQLSSLISSAGKHCQGCSRVWQTHCKIACFRFRYSTGGWLGAVGLEAGLPPTKVGHGTMGAAAEIPASPLPGPGTEVLLLLLLLGYCNKSLMLGLVEVGENLDDISNSCCWSQQLGFGPSVTLCSYGKWGDRKQPCNNSDGLFFTLNFQWNFLFAGLTVWHTHICAHTQSQNKRVFKLNLTLYFPLSSYL